MSKLLQKLNAMIGKDKRSAFRGPQEGVFACYNTSGFFDLANSYVLMRKEHPRAQIAIFRDDKWQLMDRAEEDKMGYQRRPESTYVATPFNNNRAFGLDDSNYVIKTTRDLSHALQRAGVVWPTHEIQIILCRHMQHRRLDL